jgi:sulfate transport system ATP-binding protein
MSIEIQNLTKNFGKQKILEDINIKIQNGRLVSILGPSGSGKTTLLRIIAGLELNDKTKENIFINNKNVNNIPANKREIGFVFQHYSLFPHMTVEENIAFGLKVKNTPKTEIDKTTLELLQIIQLETAKNKKPTEISGGQRQRVALAKAIATKPKILLLDEPFGALDAKIRKELRHWFHQFHKENRITTLFVTHDQEEAFEISDEIIILNEGKIEQIGTPQEIKNNPQTMFVENFLGLEKINHDFCI